jgi:hypothetical protein
LYVRLVRSRFRGHHSLGFLPRLAKVWIVSDITAAIRLDLLAGSDFEPVHRLTPMRFNQCPPNVNAGIARSVAQAFPHSLSPSQLCGPTVLRSQQQPEQAALSKRWNRGRLRVTQPVFMNSVNGTIHAILSLVGSAKTVGSFFAPPFVSSLLVGMAKRRQRSR